MANICYNKLENQPMFWYARLSFDDVRWQMAPFFYQQDHQFIVVCHGNFGPLTIKTPLRWLWWLGVGESAEFNTTSRKSATRTTDEKRCF